MLLIKIGFILLWVTHLSPSHLFASDSICRSGNAHQCDQECSGMVSDQSNWFSQKETARSIVSHPTSTSITLTPSAQNSFDLQRPTPITSAEPTPANSLSQIGAYCKTYYATEDGAGWQLINMGLNVAAAGVCAFSCQQIMVAGVGVAPIMNHCQRAALVANATEFASVVAMNWATLGGRQGSSLDQAAAWMSVLGAGLSTVAPALHLGGAKREIVGAVGALGGTAAVGSGVSRILSSQQTNQASPTPNEAQQELNKTNAGLSLGEDTSKFAAGMGLIKGAAGVGRWAVVLKEMKNAPGINACITSILYAVLAGLRAANIGNNCKIKDNACGEIKNLQSKKQPILNATLLNSLKNLSAYGLPSAFAQERSGSSVIQALEACNKNQDSCFLSGSSYQNSLDGQIMTSAGLTDFVLPLAQGIRFEQIQTSADTRTVFTQLATDVASQLNMSADALGLFLELSDAAQWGADHANALVTQNPSIARFVSSLDPSATNSIARNTSPTFTNTSLESFFTNEVQDHPIFHPNDTRNLFEIASDRIHQSKIHLNTQE